MNQLVQCTLLVSYRQGMWILELQLFVYPTIPHSMYWHCKTVSCFRSAGFLYDLQNELLALFSPISCLHIAYWVVEQIILSILTMPDFVKDTVWSTIRDEVWFPT